jgi:hypothetical protein
MSSQTTTPNLPSSSSISRSSTPGADMSEREKRRAQNRENLRAHYGLQGKKGDVGDKGENGREIAGDPLDPGELWAGTSGPCSFHFPSRLSCVFSRQVLPASDLDSIATSAVTRVDHTQRRFVSSRSYRTLDRSLIETFFRRQRLELLKTCSSLQPSSSGTQTKLHSGHSVLTICSGFSCSPPVKLFPL